jgi:general secretion pathway protein F
MLAVTPPTAFAYRAMRHDGTVERGTLDALSRDGALRVLADRGLFPLEVNARLVRRAVSTTRMPVGDLALGLRMLADLLESGLPLGRALAALHELAPEGWRVVLPSVREAVRQGKSLAAALAAAPSRPPELVVGVLRAGEAGSGLAAAARRAAEITEEAATTRDAIRGALAYPLFLAIAGAASVGLLVGMVIPRFASILADLGQALPPSTRLVLAVADVVRSRALVAFAVVVAAYAAWRVWTASEPGRHRWHALLLDAPLIGAVRRAAATSRVCAALSALLESGISIAPALTHAAQAAGDAAMAARLQTVREDVVRGERLATALATRHAATPTAFRLAHAGEESGRLAAMLSHAAKLERERAARLVRSSVRLLEPVLIVVFGGLTALVAAALLQAIYSVRPGA